MRHAEVSYVGERDPEVVRLTERGLEQAAAAHRALEDVELRPRRDELAAADGRDGGGRRAGPRAASSGPSSTSGAAGGSTTIPPEELEQVFVGSLQIRDEEARFLGGESLGEALDRVLPAFERLLAEEWETALAVFHGGVNRILVSHALAGGRTYFGNFEQAPGVHQRPRPRRRRGWIVRTVNYIPYDPLHPARTTTMEHLWSELKPWLDERA